MMLIPKGRTYGRIDKSVLPFGTPPRVEDEAYLRYRGTVDCEACGKPATTGMVVAAHVRAGNEGGAGYKPSDDLTVSLCDQCHADQEGHPGADWWLGVLKRILRRRYLTWRSKQDAAD